MRANHGEAHAISNNALTSADAVKPLQKFEFKYPAGEVSLGSLAGPPAPFARSPSVPAPSASFTPPSRETSRPVLVRSRMGPLSRPTPSFSPGGGDFTPVGSGRTDASSSAPRFDGTRRMRTRPPRSEAPI